MIVLQLTECPVSLRGDLTHWLLEISSGVYVGQVSARVRDALWERVQTNCRNGRATLVYSSDGEQHLDFRVHGDVWEPIDFDGIKLMLRPSLSRLAAKQTARSGFSDAAKYRKIKRLSQAPASKPKPSCPTDYIVVDIETTGLSPDTDEITEISALKVTGGSISDTFQTLLQIEGSVPPFVRNLTGISDDMLKKEGRDPKDAMGKFLSFIADTPLVAHNAGFDQKFLLRACNRQGFRLFTNRSIDTLSLARRLLPNLPDHKLETLAAHFGISTNETHRAMADCETTNAIYVKLIKFANSD